MSKIALTGGPDMAKIAEEIGNEIFLVNFDRKRRKFVSSMKSTERWAVKYLHRLASEKAKAVHGCHAKEAKRKRTTKRDDKRSQRSTATRKQRKERTTDEKREQEETRRDTGASAIWQYHW